MFSTLFLVFEDLGSSDFSLSYNSQLKSVLTLNSHILLRTYFEFHWYDAKCTGIKPQLPVSVTATSKHGEKYLTTSAHCVLTPQRFHSPGLASIFHLFSGMLAFCDLFHCHISQWYVVAQLGRFVELSNFICGALQKWLYPAGPFISKKNVRTVLRDRSSQQCHDNQYKSLQSCFSKRRLSSKSCSK